VKARLAIGSAVALVLLLAAWVVTPLALIPSFRSALAGSPGDFGLASQRVEIAVGEPRVPLVAWWMPAPGARDVVLVLHDGNSNRSFLWENGLALARALHDRGHHVLAPDLRGHGESGEAESTPLGRELAPDVSAWLDEIERRAGALPAGVVGFGLGGQVALYAGARDARIRAVVADSTWADLRSSVAVSIPSATGLPGFWVRWSLFGAERLHGLDFSASRAVDVVAALSDRLLLVTNEEDPQVPRRQLRWLAREAGHAEVWVTPAPPPDHPLYASAGPWGTHSRSCFLYPAEYGERVGSFLERNLR
jgi:alpha-beta hydrolase superfamily lysophospholipase